jgi:hypothetical protein
MIMLETAPLIEDSGFVPDLPGAEMALIAACDGALEAALRGFGASDAPAAAEARGALLFDLFVDARSGYRAEGAGRSAEDILATTSWRGWLMGEDSATLSSQKDGRGLKELWAAFEDVDGDGKEDEPIVVKGDRKVDDDSGGDTGGGYGDGSYPGEPGSPEPGDGGGTNLDEQEQNDCRDRKALEARDQIDADSNENTKEHGIIIYRDANGVLQKSGLIEGGYLDIPGTLVVAEINRLGIQFSQIVGWVHNHPTYSYGNAPELNRYPSGGAVEGGDWNSAEWFVANGAGGPNGANFALYIIDTIDVMREFKYSDRAMYMNLDDDDRVDGKNLPDPVESDGSSCG